MHPESRLRRAWVARIGGIHPLPFATASHSTTPGNGGVQAGACAVSAVSLRRMRWDTLQVVLALLVFVRAWPIGALLAPSAMPRFPVPGTVVVVFLLVLVQGWRR